MSEGTSKESAPSRVRPTSLDRTLSGASLGTSLDGPVDAPVSPNTDIVKKFKFMQKLCPGNHALESYKTKYDDYSCSHCEKKFPRGTILRGCRICDYDTCVTCDNENMQRESNVFAAIDKNHDGDLSKAEIVEAAEKINMTKEEAEQLFDQLDANGDGKVTWEEFHNSRIDVAREFQGIVPSFYRKASACCGCMPRGSRKSSSEVRTADSEEKMGD